MLHWINLPGNRKVAVGACGSKYTLHQNPNFPYNFSISVEQAVGDEGSAVKMVETIEEYQQRMWEVL